MTRRLLGVVTALLLLGCSAAQAQLPPSLIYGNNSGSPVPVKVSSDGTVATSGGGGGGAGGTTQDTDDASIAAGQTADLVLSATMAYDGSVWRRLTFGTAGTASTQVLTVQGIASMTAIATSHASGSVASGAFASGSIASGAIASGAVSSGAVASGAYASGSISDGAMVTLGTKTDDKSTATDTTSVSAMSVLKQISASSQSLASTMTTATTANTQKRIISAGTTEDETQVKATSGVLAGLSCTNAHASSDAFIKFTNLTAANTTPGTSTVFYSAMIPFGGGIVDRNIEIAFDTALTAYIVLGKADNAVDEVGANDIHCNISYR